MLLLNLCDKKKKNSSVNWIANRILFINISHGAHTYNLEIAFRREREREKKGKRESKIENIKILI